MQKRLMVTPGTDVGQSGAQRGDARHVHARFGFGHGAAEDHVVDFVLGDLRVAFQQRADHGGRQIVRTRIAQRASRRLADGGAEAIDNYSFLHMNPS